MRVGLGREVAAALSDKDFPRLERAINSRTKADESDRLGCRIWMGAKNRDSSKAYGYIHMPDGKQWRVHVIMAYAFAGFLSAGAPDVQVGHTCGKSLCVVPHHLSFVTPRQNVVEGFARYHLDDLIAKCEILLAEYEVRDNQRSEFSLGTRTAPQPVDRLHWHAVNQVDELRGQGMLRSQALVIVGLHAGAYERARSKYCPERVRRNAHPGGLENSLEARDAVRVLDYVKKNVRSEETGSNPCWIWQGRTTNGRPSAGTTPRHRYIARAVEWSSLGFPGKLDNLPWVWRQCESILCVNPSHLRLITEYLCVIEPRVLQQRLDKITHLREALEFHVPDHPLLAEMLSFVHGAWSQPRPGGATSTSLSSNGIRELSAPG